MSEFFKALEQAERDRLRQDETETPTGTPVSRAAAHENGKVPEPVVAKPSVATVAKPTVPKRLAPEPTATQPATPRPVAAPQNPSVPEPPPAKPSSFGQAPAPVRVFRASLRAPERSRLLGRVSKHQPRLVALTDPNSIEADAYRTVRTNIDLMSDGARCRHIAITSASGGDGKSTTAANLAVVAAQGGRRVCLIDADFRRPTVHDVFGIPNTDGLAVALEHGKPLQAVAKQTDIQNLSVVVAGRGADETFHDVLTAHRLEITLRESETAFDFVVFDSPPVTSVADALSVAAVCDGVILVVRAGSMPFNVIERAIGQIRQVKGRVLGVLLNQADLRATDYRAYHSARPKS